MYQSTSPSAEIVPPTLSAPRLLSSTLPTYCAPANVSFVSVAFSPVSETSGELLGSPWTSMPTVG